MGNETDRHKYGGSHQYAGNPDTKTVSARPQPLEAAFVCAIAHRASLPGCSTERNEGSPPNPFRSGGLLGFDNTRSGARCIGLAAPARRYSFAMAKPTESNALVHERSLPIWGFLVIVVVYLAIIQGVGLSIKGWADLTDGKLLTVNDVLISMWIPLGLALVFTYAVVAALGWWRPVFRDDRPVQRWIWFVPIAFIVAILLSTNFGQLADRGVGFTIVLLIACQFVGWGEEGMFRGIGVTTLRQHGLTEGKVALWSSLIFGAVHLTNVVDRGVAAIPQALAVSFAGYFFYLIRRVSKGNVLNSVLHGLFDFALLSATSIGGSYIGSAAAILLYLVLTIVLVVRRHKIEPAAATAAAAGPVPST